VPASTTSSGSTSSSTHHSLRGKRPRTFPLNFPPLTFKLCPPCNWLFHPGNKAFDYPPSLCPSSFYRPLSGLTAYVFPVKTILFYSTSPHCWHGGTMVSTAASQRQGREIDSRLRHCLCGGCTFFPCLRGFPPGAPIASHRPKYVQVGCIGCAKFSLSIPKQASESGD